MNVSIFPSDLRYLSQPLPRLTQQQVARYLAIRYGVLSWHVHPGAAYRSASPAPDGDSQQEPLLLDEKIGGNAMPMSAQPEGTSRKRREGSGPAGNGKVEWDIYYADPADPDAEPVYIGYTVRQRGQWLGVPADLSPPQDRKSHNDLMAWLREVHLASSTGTVTEVSTGTVTEVSTGTVVVDPAAVTELEVTADQDAGQAEDAGETIGVGQQQEQPETAAEPPGPVTETMAAQDAPDEAWSHPTAEGGTVTEEDLKQEHLPAPALPPVNDPFAEPEDNPFADPFA